MEGVFAGNVFDLGSATTIALYNSGQIDFRTTRDNLRRPFLVDNVAQFIHRLNTGSPYVRAMVFVDNCGSDFVLGVLPFCRELLRRGVSVILAANSSPSLNDVTYAELLPLLQRIANVCSDVGLFLSSGKLSAVPSGNILPVIDLSKVSVECAEAAQHIDLLVLEGMGRALETNYNMRFKCDCLKLAMVKHKEVADFLGGNLFDVVCRFDECLR